jgi:phytoene dehydrogenase-like protein
LSTVDNTAFGGGQLSRSGSDVLIVGGGHNGLVAAFYLARAGLTPTVLERRGVVGGACVTEEFAPGFRASPGAYVLSMPRPDIWRDMRLVARGLKADPSGPSLNIFPDGSQFSLFADTKSSVEAIEPLSKKDARRYPLFEKRLEEVARAILPLADKPPPDPSLRKPTDYPRLAELAWHALRNRAQLSEIAFLFSTSTGGYLDEHFESEELKTALGWESISNTLAGPYTPGTGYHLLHEAASGSAGGGLGWGFVRGGMGSVTNLMAEAARERGVIIRTDAEVERILTSAGRVTGVALTNGEELRSTTVLSNADPKRTFLGLVDEGDLPEEFVAAIRAYRCDGASMKINLALSHLPFVSGLPNGSPQPYHRGLIQVTKPLADLDRDQAQARLGIPSPSGHIELCFPSVHDPSLAPEGQHVATLGVRSQPYSLAGTTWDKEREAAADRAIEQLGVFLPDLPGSVLHRQVLTPLDLERTLYLTGGHHLHGDMSPDQLLFMRPVRGYASYRTPIRGLYLCGAGTHPGGGVTGANGRNAARQVITDTKRRRRAWAN